MTKKFVTINGTVYWAFLNRTNDDGKYSVEIGNLSDKDVDSLESLGLKVKFNENKPEKGNFITCYSKNFPFKPLDTSGNEITGVIIGNGTKCRAVIGTYGWEFKNKKGVSPSLKKLTITDLVEYFPDEAEATEDAEL